MLHFLKYPFIWVIIPYILFAQVPVDANRDLFYAIFDNDYLKAEKALNQGANPNAVYIYERYADECRNWLPAHSAAAIGNLKIMKLLKLKGADFSKQISNGDACQLSTSPLHIAAGYGSIELLDYLLQEGLPIEIQAADGRTPLFDAVLNGKYEATKFLLEKGANPNHIAKVCTLKMAETPIFSSIVTNRHDLFELLCDKGAKLNDLDLKESPLHRAIRSENLQAAADLIKRGANPMAKNEAGETALDVAKKSENSRFAQLLENGSLLARDKKMLELLSYEDMEKFKLVLKNSPKLTFRDLNGKEVLLSDFKDKLVIVNVWATWCSPCLREMPTFKELLKKLNRKDLILLSVSIDQKLAKLKDFAAKNPYPFTYLHDPEASVRSLFGGFVPATFIIDKKGEWIASVDGSIDWDRKDIRAFLEFLAEE